MVKMSELDSPELKEAVQLWTGWGFSAMPNRNDKRLSDRFGNEIAAKLLPLIKSLEADFYSSDAKLVAANLEEMGKLASEQFKHKYPKVADEIVAAFAWCYTFDFR